MFSTLFTANKRRFFYKHTRHPPPPKKKKNIVKRQNIEIMWKWVEFFSCVSLNSLQGASTLLFKIKKKKKPSYFFMKEDIEISKRIVVKSHNR